MSDAPNRPRLLTHADLDELEAMRQKILEAKRHLQSDPLLHHLVEVELPRLIATARCGVDGARG
jgi:hypothetical protein